MYKYLILSSLMSVSLVGNVYSSDSSNPENQRTLPSNFDRLSEKEQNDLLVAMGILTIDPVEATRREQLRRQEEEDARLVREMLEREEQRVNARRVQQEARAAEEAQRQTQLRAQEEADRQYIERMIREEREAQNAERERRIAERAQLEEQERQRRAEEIAREEAESLRVIAEMQRQEQEELQAAQRERQRMLDELASQVQAQVSSSVPSNVTNIALSTNESLVVRKGEHGYGIDCEVNGQACAFLYDTGATMTTIPYEDCQRFGINVANLVFDVRTSTANGETTSAKVNVGSLKIGQLIALNNFRVFVTRPNTLNVPLLGNDVMEHLDCNIRQGVMTLKALQ